MSVKTKLGKTIDNQASIWVLTSRRPKEKFQGSNIDAPIPYGKGPESRRKFRTISGEVDSLMLFQHSTVLRGDRNENDKHNIDVLVSHEDVFLPDLSNEEWNSLVNSNQKRPNPRWELKNLDREEDKIFDDEQTLLELRFWLRDPANPISLEKSIFIASYLGIPYKTENDKYAHKPSILQRKLIQKIDTAIANSKSAYKTLLSIKDKDVEIEIRFFVERMKEFGMINFNNSIYFIGEVPIGPSDDSIFRYFNDKPVIFQKHKESVLDFMKTDLSYQAAIEAKIEEMRKEQIESSTEEDMLPEYVDTILNSEITEESMKEILSKKYESLFGVEPHHNAKLETIATKIKEKLESLTGVDTE